MSGYYGEAPADLGALDLPNWQEFMHYLYLPVRIPARDDIRRGVVCDVHTPATGPQYAVPERLGFLGPHLWTVMRDAEQVAPHLDDPYVYVTARRGFATPGNPLNRPGWHCDDFGGTDLNYIWTDAFPTRVLRSHVDLGLPTDDAASLTAMEMLAEEARDLIVEQRARDEVFGLRPALEPSPDEESAWITDVPLRTLLRLTPYVIHDTPVIPEPGGMRSFVKISVSTHRYNLLGNSHNHLLDYDWPMYDRAAVRNQPGGNSDYVEEHG